MPLKKIGLFLIMCLLMGLDVLAIQGDLIPYQKEIDSLKKDYSLQKDPLKKAKTVYELSFFYSYSDSSQSKAYLEQGLQLSKNSDLWLAIGKVYEGAFYMDYDHVNGLRIFREAEKALQQFQDPLAYYYRAKSLSNMATIYQWQDKQLEMMDVLMKEALPASLKAKDEVLIGNVYYKIGLNFWNNIQYSNANKYLLLAIQHMEKGNYDVWILEESYKMLILSQCSSGLLKEAKSTLAKYEKFVKANAGEIPISNYYYNQAVYFRFSKQYDSAVTAMKKAISAFKSEKLTDIREISSLYFQLSLIQYDQGDYKAALNSLQLSEKAYEGRDFQFFQDSVNMAVRYYMIYEKLGEHKNAFEWSKKYIELRDTLFERKIRESILDYEVKYKTLEKEKEINGLKADKEKSDLVIRNTWIIAGLILMIILIILYFLSKSQQKNRRLLALDAMLQGEEKERNRLSRDLHDGLGSVLASIKYKMLDVDKSKQEEKVNAMLNEMDFAITEMRRISLNLMPEALRRFGLQVSLEDLCKSLQNSKTQIELQFYGELNSLSHDKQTHIYRIVQELLNNSLKHAHPQHILVQCSLEEHAILITVEDDGAGFDVDVLEKKENEGSGLKNVKTRINYLHGTMDVQSQPGKGTTINIELPFKHSGKPKAN